jgi:hypothetical protein
MTDEFFEFFYRVEHAETLEAIRADRQPEIVGPLINA